MNRSELAKRALSLDELDELKVSVDNYDDLNAYSEDMEEWYNEAVWVAAELFVQAAEESDRFCQSFLKDETYKTEMPSGDTVPADKWRDVMQEEVPEYYEEVMGLNLSAFQGGSAESTARRVLSNDSKSI